MAQKIILECDKCGKEFELTVGHLKSTAGKVSNEEIEQKDGKKAKDFVAEIFNHKCDGKISLKTGAFVD